MTTLTVLHLATNRWWTGSADPILLLLRGLADRGHRPLLGVVPGDRFEAKAREAGLAPVAGLRLEARLAPVAFVRDVRRLRAIVAEEGVDLLHAHHSHDHWLAMLAAGRGRGRVPVARTFHNVRSVRRDRFAARLYARTCAVFAVSRQIEARCRDVGIAAERVVWVPGSVDLLRFARPGDPAAVRREFGVGHAPLVVSVGRMAPDRGHELLLEGFRRLSVLHPDARLLLVGKGELRTRLERLAAERGLADRVHFAGYRDRDLPEILAAATCFALMGAGSDESCRAALEAMAAGRPVVARRVGALPETVIDGETGRLIEEDTPEGVASALAELLADPELAERMGAAGRRRAEHDFSPVRTVTITESVYRRCVSST